MKAAVVHSFDQPLVVGGPIPEPGPERVLARIEATA